MQQSASLSTKEQLVTIAVIVVSSFIVSVSAGMNAVIFPTTMQAIGINTSLIGIIMALEIVAVFIIGLFLAKIMKSVGLRNGLVLASLLRVPPLLLLPHLHNAYNWATLMFIHGIGLFFFLIALQTWLNSIPFKNKGLVIALQSTAMSVGMAAGPVLLQFSHEGSAEPFFNSAAISLFALIPILFGLPLIPRFKNDHKEKVLKLIRMAPAVMFAGILGGASIFGIQSFIVIYGTENGMSFSDAALLLTSFMMGSLLLEAPMGWISDFFDRRYVLIIGVFSSMVCTIYLPIAIYTTYIAWALLFFWGGVIGGVYSICLTMIGERFEGNRLVAANGAFSMMDSIGGATGVVMIGMAIDFFGSDGLPYVIVLFSIAYYAYALTRYRVI